MNPFETTVIFLNRSCPRKCQYCLVREVDVEGRLNVDQWIRAFEILEKRGMKFFLVLGTEPLLMGDELVELVRYWKRKDFEYGLYSTSPSGVFEKYADKLVDAGLRSWSSGIDFVECVYEGVFYVGGSVSNKMMKLTESVGGKEIRKKASDGIAGLKYMQERGVPEIHVLITISRFNIEIVPDMIVWLEGYFGNRLTIGLNYVEYGNGDMDFAPSKEVCGDFCFQEEDRQVWYKFLTLMEGLDSKYKQQLQVDFNYFGNWDWLRKLNRKSLACAPAIECNGSLRKCGYRTGFDFKWFASGVFALDSDEVYNEFVEVWKREVEKCDGCYWVFPYIIEQEGGKILDFRSKFWQERFEKVEKE